ncbi:MAG: sterol desaturase family protein [Candidatus Binatia bacterium]
MSTATAADVGTPTATTLAASDSPRTLAEAIPVFLRHTSPRVVIALLAFALALRVWVGDWSWWNLVPVAALSLYWPVQEWLIHVFILHYKPMTVLGRRLDFHVPQKHRAHHRAPWQLELLFIPQQSFWYTVPLIVALWFALTPTPALALTGIVTHLALALHYEWVHFLVHTRVMPRTALYQRLWRNHRLHHFKNEHYWFGVTMLSGDRLLHTAPAVGDVPTSPTARALHG